MRKISFMKKLTGCFFCIFWSVFPVQARQRILFSEPDGLSILRKAYPDVTFQESYDPEQKDWKIKMTSDGHSRIFYWAGGRMLPPENRTETDKYWPLLYRYADSTPDPATFTAEEIDRIRNFSSTGNRQHGASTPLFFFNAVYDAATRASMEQHLVRIPFLGKRVSVHKKITGPLHRVQDKLYALAKTDSTVKSFIDSLSRADGYYWRDIRDRSSRSFHSFGLAVDLLPVGWNRKIVYWNWQKQQDPDGWMLTPLSKRWMPPEKVIETFESEGFIWGGKWGIWDNMHFEYRPELIVYRDVLKNKS